MITNECIASYPAVFEPKETLSGDLKYSITLLIPKSDTAGVELLRKEIAKAIEKGKATKWSGKLPKFRYEPLRDGDKELEDGTKEGKEYEGHYFINVSCNTENPPGVVGADARPLMDRQELYSGCVVRVDLRAYPYKNGGNSGVAWWLSNIMKVRDGERLDGKMNAVDAFAAYAVKSDDDIPF